MTCKEEYPTLVFRPVLLSHGTTGQEAGGINRAVMLSAATLQLNQVMVNSLLITTES